ncbi:MAG TPA: ParB N-terminal domain-containing protein [Paracoccus sp. (in: a-proteobacteria)]|uniref:ParB/RepB/Spo0J family partition protein n=1 Tax=Paracoccus sp. TaxID=267 RepID=UPI002BB655D9|nr:ParB N-terminal domain-containing protein [Paracoccus sp. (in: a-proteobacteria)]HWL58400.1 ParB N-terminal domain-containing protein [Paracoccus sp. (in: a-proteobacteria)]
MAKRRQLEAPTREQLKEIEDGFARETRRDPLGMSVPIATVAAEAAALAQVHSTEERAEAARNRKDAERFRDAEARGLLARDVPLSEIIADQMIRDRMTLDPEEMAELKASILSHGLRLPIELFELAVPQDGKIYGLISGFRRLSAVKALHGETGNPQFATIRALVRNPQGSAEAFVAMVEENEIRSDLSQYERGRVAVVAADNGAFESVEDAIDQLFSSGSKAKRSKLRSFALIHEELGDLLTFPQALSERQGLRLAAALRAGLTDDVRRVLAASAPTDGEGEWSLLEPVLQQTESVPRDPSRGGRPRRTADRSLPGRVKYLPDGARLRHDSDGVGHFIRIEGVQITDDLIELAMQAIEIALTKGT